MFNRYIILIHLISISTAQDIFTGYVVENHDTLDIFSYQIPSLYSDDSEHPLLVAFHQWGGNQDTPYHTLSLFLSFDHDAAQFFIVLLLLILQRFFECLAFAFDLGEIESPFCQALL